jgi:hypothetical protein
MINGRAYLKCRFLWIDADNALLEVKRASAKDAKHVRIHLEVGLKGVNGSKPSTGSKPSHGEVGHLDINVRQGHAKILTFPCF